MLETLPLEQRRFLLHTSILERLSGPLCDAVLDTTGSAALLDQLERANLFLVPLEGRDAYRYHPLFATMLRSRLEREEPEVTPTLHARASAWLEEHNDVEAAVEHAIAGRDTRPCERPRRDAVPHSYERRSGCDAGALARPLAACGAGRPQLALVRAAVAGQTARSSEEVEHWLEIASSGRAS